MPLDPQTAALLALLDSLGGQAIAEGTPEEGRRAMRMLAVDLRDPASLVQVGAIDDLEVDGADGPLPARRYRPEGGEGPLPTIVWLHGGGFVLGDLDTHEGPCRQVCAETGAVVLSVAYRLAPEHPFPAAVDDAIAAVGWAAAHIDDLGGDAERLVVAGDSAGGNLAAVVAQHARDAGGPRLAAQLLVYPATDLEDEGGERYPSRLANAEGYFLTEADLRWFGRHYVGAANPTDPRLSPLRGDLEGVAPAVVVTAEYDPLRDEGEAYARALADAGVEVVAHRFDGLIHGFIGLSAQSAASAEALRTTCASLRALVEAVPAGREV